MGTTLITNFFKLILAYIMAACSIFLPVQPDNIPFTVEPIDTNDTSIVYTYKNTTNQFILGHSYIVKMEKKTDGEWQEIEFYYNGVTEEGFYIGPSVEYTEKYWFTDGDIHTVDDEVHLSEGEYRMTIKYKVLNKLRKINVDGYSTSTFTVTAAQ